MPSTKTLPTYLALNRAATAMKLMPADLLNAIQRGIIEPDALVDGGPVFIEESIGRVRGQIQDAMYHRNIGVVGGA